MIQLAIHEAINGRDLDYAIARATMEEMMDGTATDIEMAILLTALRMKGETITEITACAEVMREKGAHIEPKGAVMDIVGTGGDEVGSFNISTTSAFVAAAGGVPVAKHGNRSVSSKSGAADVLEELGVVLNLTPEQNEKVLSETGICFLFAQGYHKSMKNVAPVRKGMGERTIFNVLGPLSNPARATMQLLGVYDESLVMPMAQVLSNLGVTRGMVVCGGGMDEASLIGTNKVCEIRDGKLTPYELDPEKHGLMLCTVDDLRGGSPKANAQITRDILSGREQGAKREEILLNAGIALYLGLDGLSLADGIKKAAELIDSARERVTADKAIIPLAEMKAQAEALPKGDFRFEKALAGKECAFICEVKKASPSKGVIDPVFDFEAIAQSYEQAGADCVSCLTEPKWFLGSDEIFRKVRKIVTKPMIRKDFTVDEYQIYQAKVLGADAVLLICTLLDTEMIKRYLAICDSLGLSALVETHDAAEMQSAVRAGARLIGVNNRNLKDFTVDLGNAARLRQGAPDGTIFVAESGVSLPEDAAALRKNGADAILVGEYLMRAENKKQALDALREAAK